MFFLSQQPKLHMRMKKISIVIIGVGSASLYWHTLHTKQVVDHPTMGTEQTVQSSPYHAWPENIIQPMIFAPFTGFALTTRVFTRVLHGQWPTTPVSLTCVVVCKKDAIFAILWGSTITPPKLKSPCFRGFFCTCVTAWLPISIDYNRGRSRFERIFFNNAVVMQKECE